MMTSVLGSDTQNLLTAFSECSAEGVTISAAQGVLRISNHSSSEVILVAQKTIATPELFCLACYEGECLQGNAPVFRIVDKEHEIIGEATIGSKSVFTVSEQDSFSPALRVEAQSETVIKQITVSFFSDQEQREAYLLEGLTSNILVITPSYPTMENKYFAAFVHARLKAYKEAGIDFDVTCCFEYQEICKYTFEGIDVLRIPFVDLRSVLRRRKYEKILVHFFDHRYSAVFDACDLGDAELLFWIHGPETLYWDWPEFTTSYFSDTAAVTEENLRQFEFSDKIIRKYNADPRVSWVFVSEWIKKRSESLIGLQFKNYSIIPNIIDSNVFLYEEKNAEQRNKIFMIRRFDDIAKYAIDVAVHTILELSRRPCFADLEFSIFGTGAKHDVLLAPISGLPNVSIYPWFLKHEDIAAEHKKNGIALFPTRYDAQGVSMCEAAMSGMAVVSSVNDAVAEFLPDDIGVLAETENYQAYADIIEKMYDEPDYFMECGRACHSSVHKKCDFENTVQKEIDLINAKPSYRKEITKVSQDEHPLLTIVVPSYNVSTYLRHGVATLLNQQYANRLEVIIVDDGSKDDTAEVAADLLERYNGARPVLQLITKPNGGHGSAINIGLEHATGTYFRVIDGDDWVNSEELESLLEILERETSDIVLTDYSEDRAKESALIRKNLYPFMKRGITYHFEDLCYPDYGFEVWGPILATGNFKTEMLRKTGFKLSEKSYYVDMQFDMYSILLAETISYYPLDIYRYFIGREGQSISKASYIRNCGNHLDVLMGLLRYVDNHPEVSSLKKGYIVDKLIKPMAKSQYIICAEWMGDKKEFLKYDNLLRDYGEVYYDESVASAFIRLHRKTRGILLPFNKQLIWVNELLKRMGRLVA